MKIKTLIPAVIVTILCTSAFADGTHDVKGYTKKDGTYVGPHKQTNPDDSKANNWSSKGNVNPETGKKGTVDPDKPSASKKK